MIERAIKLFLFVFICAVAIVFLRFGCENSSAIDVMPKVVGSASTDSIRINFCTMDTTYYPAVLDADSLIILIYPPDNAAPESTADGGTGVFNLTTGYYQYHRRGSNATPDVGIYTVCVKAWRGSAVRGIGTCSYLVTGAGTYHYGVQDSTRDFVDTEVGAIKAKTDGLNFDGNNVLADVMAMNSGVVTAAAIADNAIDAPTYANDAQFMVYGGAVWVDTTNGTAGAVVGVNGLPSLPCRGFAKAKIIADAIGIKTFCILGGGDQSIKATMNGYTFMGIGDPARNKIDLNSQDIGGSMFIDLNITGIQGGDRAAFVRCALKDVSLDAVALQCGLRGDITLLGDRDNVFLGCASSVPGGLTPTLIFSGGSESVQFRGYSGGIHLYGMGANDSLSFEAIGGQLQIGAGVNVNAEISARGMITITDSTAGLNNLTYAATAQYAIDSTMNALANKANFMADVSAIADTVNATLDTIQAHAPHGNDWGQGGGNLAAITDTVNAILDTIQAHAPHGNDWGQGGGSLAAITDTVNALLDTIQAGFGSQTNQGDMIKISGDATAADNLEATLDGTGGVRIDLQELHIKAGNNDTAVFIYGPTDLNATEPTLLIVGASGAGANAPAVRLDGGTDGEGIYIITSSDDGIEIASAGISSYDINLAGDGTIHGTIDVATTVTNEVTADMVKVSGDAPAANNLETMLDGTGGQRLSLGCLDIKATDNDTAFIAWGSGSGRGTYFRGGTTAWTPASEIRTDALAPALWVTSASSEGIEIQAGGHGIYIDAGNAYSSIKLVNPGGEIEGDIVGTVTFVESTDTVIDPVSAVSCAGWGAYTVTLYLLSDADSTAVKGVNININDSTSGVWQAGHITPANGIRQFSLDASTYAIHLQDPPNAITSPEYMTISADTTDTFWVETFDPGAPPSGDQCRIWCVVSGLSANWLSGCRLTAEIPRRYHTVTLDGRPISPYSISATSNDTGYVYLNPYESGELTAGDGTSTVKMRITLTAPNGYVIARTLVEIPDASDWEIVW